MLLINPLKVVGLSVLFDAGFRYDYKTVRAEVYAPYTGYTVRKSYIYLCKEHPHLEDLLRGLYTDSFCADMDVIRLIVPASCSMAHED